MRRKILWTVLGLVVVAAVWWWLQPSALDRLDVLVAELRARGDAVTMEELEPPPVPDEENGAAEIDAALAWLDEHLEPGWKNEIVGPWNPNVVDDYMVTSTPEELDALRAFLVDIAPFQAHETVTDIERLSRAVDAQPSWEPAYEQELASALGESSSWMWQRKLLEVVGRTQAAHDLARIALAACEYCSETGRWPAALADLGPLLGGVIEQNPHTRGRYVLQVQGDALTLSGVRPGTPIDSADDRGALEWFLLPDVVSPR